MEGLSDKLSNETRRNLAVNTAKSALQTKQDYLPWQRTTRTEANAGQSRLSSSFASPTLKSDAESRPFSVGSVRTACSSKCRHTWNKNYVVPPISVEEEQKRRRLLIVLKLSSAVDAGSRLMQRRSISLCLASVSISLADDKMQIKMKELSLCEYKKCFQQLLAENSKIKKEIADSEEKNHSEAKSLLQRYARFRGTIGSLQKQYNNESTTSLEDYGKTEERIRKELEDFQRQTEELDVAVVTKNNEVKTLLNYKEKEYPGKVLAIAKLKRQRERLRVAHENELEELLTAIHEDKATSLAKEELLNNNVRDLFTEEAILSMNEHIKAVGLQNMIMRKEIEIHKNEVKPLKSDILDLQAKISKILEEKQHSDQSLPAISCNMATKCLPEDDTQLDFPVKTWLPI